MLENSRLMIEWLNSPNKLIHALPKQCTGCDHSNGVICDYYEWPDHQWTRVGGCAAATHTHPKIKIDEKTVNPLKASKRQSKGAR